MYIRTYPVFLRALQVLFLAPLLGLGQQVEMHTEFQRVDPFGRIVAADKAENPREILSPVWVRNSYTSYHVTVTPPRGQYYHVYVVQNPESTVDIKLYREVFEEKDGKWFPNRLIPVSNPYTSRVPDLAQQVAALSAESFWVDIHISKNAPSRRFRVEVQVNSNEHWVIYPIEPRILSTTVPDHATTQIALPSFDAPADRTAILALQYYLCGVDAPRAPAAEGHSVHGNTWRNAQQDIALARSLEAKNGKDSLLARVLKASGAVDRQSWCTAPPNPGSRGAEWYMRVRDFLYRAGVVPGSVEP